MEYTYKKSYIDRNIYEQLKETVSFLLITVTEIETQSLHSKIEPMAGYTTVLVYQKDILTYYFGKLGFYNVCHVESRMGSIGAGASIMTVQQAAQNIKPKAIIMVGIAFGVDKRKQRVGDVLVSDVIISYESKKVGVNQIEYRDTKQIASTLLLNRFRNVIDWSFQLPDSTNAKTKIGHILSGEVLIDNKSYLKDLIKQFPTAIGGEMEGAGLVSAAHSSNINWILIKGICDFADGNKSKNKKENQSLAAESAVSLCYTALNNPIGFEDLGIYSSYTASITKVSDIQYAVDKAKLRIALFNSYSEEAEPYYLERIIDNNLLKYTEINHNIWVHGISGSGKTAAVFRNIISSKKPLFVIDLSCHENDPLNTFNYIIDKLSEKIPNNSFKHKADLMHAMDEVCSILNNAYNEHYIVFEEMPINEDGTIIKYFLQLIIKFTNKYPNLNVGFAITSINNPIKILSDNIRKITEKVHFIEQKSWVDSDSESLIDLITKSLQIAIDKQDIKLLATTANGNPRFIKSFLFNLFTSYQYEGLSFKKSLQIFEEQF